MELNTLAGRSYNDITQVSILHTSYFWSNLATCRPNIVSACAVPSFPLGSSRLQIPSVESGWSFVVSRSFKGWPSPICCSCILLITNHSLCYLMQPIGALNPERLKKFQERYSTFEDPIIPKFHYGSHYSSAGTVYLLSRYESDAYLEYWICNMNYVVRKCSGPYLTLD